jgi:IclR-like helix-turn-helix domain-containing protein
MGAVTRSSDGSGEERGFHFIQSVERAINVIRAFTAETPRLTLTDVARACGQDRATARRFLLTLADLEYVGSDGRTFFLTPKILELGYAYLSLLSIPEIVEPRLRLLVKEVRETCNVAVLDQTSIIYIARVPSPRILATSINVDPAVPEGLAPPPRAGNTGSRGDPGHRRRPLPAPADGSGVQPGGPALDRCTAMTRATGRKTPERARSRHKDKSRTRR